MRISYRSRKALGHLAAAIAILLAVAVLVWICWMVWLGRYVLYTRDGAVLDFSLQPVVAGERATPPVAGAPVSIYYNEGENAIKPVGELSQLKGYYVEPDQLKGDITQLISQIDALPADMAILMDVKNISGSFYYSSSVSEQRSATVDADAVDELIRHVAKTGRYMIARFPGLRDYEFARTHTSDAINDRRGYVWVDKNRCYWLNPTRQNTATYLMQILNELRGLGFDEAVLTDYDVPVDDAHIVFTADRSEALSQLASTLTMACATNTFAVSFVKSRDMTPPEGRSRIYLEDGDASRVNEIAEESGLEDPVTRLVFIASNNDTRFEAYGVLRPLSTAH